MMKCLAGVGISNLHYPIAMVLPSVPGLVKPRGHTRLEDDSLGTWLLVCMEINELQSSGTPAWP
jgi:hypothetical protein